MFVKTASNTVAPAKHYSYETQAQAKHTFFNTASKNQLGLKTVLMNTSSNTPAKLKRYVCEYCLQDSSSGSTLYL
jgi:hypothetical protein